MTDETEVEPTKSVETEPKVKQSVTKTVIRDTEDYVLELRKENEKLRKTLDEQSTSKAEELSNLKLETLRTETEEKATAKAEKLLEKRLAELEDASRQRLVKAELRAHAMKASVIDFDDLYDILKRGDLKKIEFDDDGEVTNAGAIIAEMKQKKAHLFAGVNTTSVDRAPTTKERANSVDKIALTMSDEEYAKALDAFRTAR